MNKLTAPLTVAVLAAGLTLGGAGFAAPALAEDTGGPPPGAAVAPPPNDVPAADTSQSERPAAEALVPDAADAADEAGPADEAGDEAPPAADPLAIDAPGTIFADFALSRVTLAGGAAMGSPVGSMSAVHTAVGADTRDVYHVTGETAGFGVGIDGSAVFEVVMLGTGTGYWLSTRVHATGDLASASCRVYQGDPRSGGVPAAVSPFTCATVETQNWPNTRFTFTVALNRYVETGGVIKTTGPITLTGGHYEFDVPYGVAGAAELGKDASTHFETVVRDGDHPMYADNARVEFVYQIVDDGTKTKFWVAGWSNNYRGVQFARDGTCFVLDRDPLADGAPSLEHSARVKVSPYSCELTNERWKGPGYGAYEAEFTVKRRAMTVLDGSGTGPNTLQARELIDKVCGANADDCGLSLASATDVQGKVRPMSETVLNGGDAPVSPTKSVTSSETVTNSGGFKFTIKSSWTGLGAKWEAALEVNYQRSVATSTSTTLSLPIATPPHTKSWWEGSPPMVRTQGTVIVLKDGIYYEIVNVTADFPNTSEGAQWVITQRYEPYLGAPQGPGAPGTDTPPARVAPAAAGGTGAGGRGSLASTGTDGSSLLAWAVVGAVLLLGGGALARTRRRRARTGG